MHIRFPYIFVAILLTLAAVSGFAVGSVEVENAQSQAQGVTPLSMEYPKSASAIPILALIDDYPADYQGSFFTDHPQALARLVSGDIDVLATGFSVGLSRHRSAGDIAHLLTPVWGVSALMTSQEINNLGDLAGGTIYAPFEGSPIDAYLKAILTAEGLADEVAIRYAPFPQAAAQLAGGAAEAAVLVEPLASRLELQGAAYRFENLHDGWARLTGGEPRSPQVSVFATTATIEDSPEALALLRRRLRETVAAVAESPGEYAERYAEAVGFPVPVVEQALKNTLFDVPESADTREIIDAYARVLGTEPPGDEFYAQVD